MLPEDVGGHGGVTICKKFPAKAAMAITAAKCLEVAVLCHAVFAVADFVTLFGGICESRFSSKKVVNWYKRLKDC